MPQTRHLPKRLVSAVALLLGLAGSGCQRKAPGPAECVRAAEILTKQPDGGALKTTSDSDFGGKLAFEKIVKRCLVSPFDRQYVDCLQGQEPKRQCLAGYRRRFELQRQARSE